ncbi:MULTISPECIES: hypothetical protein [Caproicibacterium]|uniref:Uncharacterized protein n=1 Tax=Caproicibacterium argilliputei TaxID=3030016 RepID=A0AA97D9X7_9FIRM|nr:hypothetical protein [Caproicibacterium argilliputei]WOC32009.1 hypothetical protein PXC00_12565 [Caproicibacterium argilliputei]
MTYTDAQKEILWKVFQHRRFPIVRFELHREGQPELCSIALNDVYIEQPQDSMELVKERGKALHSLTEQGILTVDYSTRVWVQGDYDVYYRSKLYEELCHAVMESSKNPAAVFNLPYMRKGYAGFTSSFLASLPQL